MTDFNVHRVRKVIIYGKKKKLTLYMYEFFFNLANTF